MVDKYVSSEAKNSVAVAITYVCNVVVSESTLVSGVLENKERDYEVFVLY